jgi:hypothetical protein
LEDCRSIYTHLANIQFKGENELKIDKIELDGTTKEILYDNHQEHEEKLKYPLKNIKTKPIPVPLHPKNNTVTFLFHRTPTDPATPISKTETLTIFYKRIPSLLSPYCGLQQEYIIERIETSFAGYKIISPALKKYQTNIEDQKKPNIEIHY